MVSVVTGGQGLISRLVPSFRQEPGGWGISDSRCPLPSNVTKTGDSEEAQAGIAGR